MLFKIKTKTKKYFIYLNISQYFNVIAINRYLKQQTDVQNGIE